MFYNSVERCRVGYVPTLSMQGLKNEWGKFPPILIILIYSKEMIFISKIELNVGDVFITNEGCEATVIKIVNRKEIYITFKECEFPIRTRLGELRSGSIKNPCLPTVCGVGYMGQGNYKGRNGGGKSKSYITWINMLRRCYDEKSKMKNPTYKECYVCEEWHNYQNFAKWYEENYYEVDGEKMTLEKDLLIRGNKIYSPETCIIAPNKINCLIIGCNSARGDYPKGVNFHKASGKYVAQCSVDDCKRKHLGLFNTPEEAFLSYKEFKEQYIKQVAEEYRDKIPTKLYEAMMKWEVEITD